MINDAIAILSEHEKVERANLDAALAEFERESARAIAQTRATPSPATAPTPALADTPPRRAARATTASGAPVVAGDSETIAKARADLTKLLNEKRSAIKQLEDSRQQRIAEINRQISEALVTLAPAHPTVVALKQRLDVATREPPELSALRSDEEALVQQIAAFGGAAVASSGSPATAPATTSPTKRAPSEVSPIERPSANEDPAVTVSRLKMQDATTKHNEIVARIESAQMELDIARAAFKYRFSILRPAEVPEKAKKPNVIALAVGGILGTIFLALLLTAMADLASGRFVELWQARRRLKIPVLGEIDTP